VAPDADGMENFFFGEAAEGCPFGVDEARPRSGLDAGGEVGGEAEVDEVVPFASIFRRPANFSRSCAIISMPIGPPPRLGPDFLWPPSGERGETPLLPPAPPPPTPPLAAESLRPLPGPPVLRNFAPLLIASNSAERGSGPAADDDDGDAFDEGVERVREKDGVREGAPGGASGGAIGGAIGGAMGGAMGGAAGTSVAVVADAADAAANAAATGLLFSLTNLNTIFDVCPLGYTDATVFNDSCFRLNVAARCTKAKGTASRSSNSSTSCSRRAESSVVGGETTSMTPQGGRSGERLGSLPAAAAEEEEGVGAHGCKKTVYVIVSEGIAAGARAGMGADADNEAVEEVEVGRDRIGVVVGGSRAGVICVGGVGVGASAAVADC